MTRRRGLYVVNICGLFPLAWVNFRPEITLFEYTIKFFWYAWHFLLCSNIAFMNSSLTRRGAKVGRYVLSSFSGCLCGLVAWYSKLSNQWREVFALRFQYLLSSDFSCAAFSFWCARGCSNNSRRHHWKGWGKNLNLVEVFWVGLLIDLYIISPWFFCHIFGFIAYKLCIYFVTEICFK